jgi:RNA polymerase sigma-70 factor (ECF subfamily)
VETRRLSEPQPGTGEAWAEFYLANRRALTTYALSLVGNPADAQDLIQDALMRMVRQHRPLRDARAYVMRGLRNLAIDRRRRFAAHPAQTPLEDEGLAFIDVDAAADREAVERVRSALRRLPDQRREVIVLKVYAGLTFGEIAEVLSIPPGTAASHYARGLDELRALLVTEPHHV